MTQQDPSVSCPSDTPLNEELLDIAKVGGV